MLQSLKILSTKHRYTQNLSRFIFLFYLTWQINPNSSSAQSVGRRIGARDRSSKALRFFVVVRLTNGGRLGRRIRDRWRSGRNGNACSREIAAGSISNSATERATWLSPVPPRWIRAATNPHLFNASRPPSLRRKKEATARCICYFSILYKLSNKSFFIQIYIYISSKPIARQISI